MPSESTMGALLPLCIHAASALPLLCLRVRCETRLYWSASASLHVISEIFLLLQCAAAGSTRAFEQRRPCTSTSVTTSNFYTLKEGHSLEPWIYKIILENKENNDVPSRLEQEHFTKMNRKSANTCLTDMINISIESFKLLLNEINQIKNKNSHYNPWRCTSL